MREGKLSADTGEIVRRIPDRCPNFGQNPDTMMRT
jgi:hypothetical protein